jgi:uncharacterized protein (TIGR03905 family)
MIYRTQGTCSRSITYEVEDGKVKRVQFEGGCDGNTQGVAKLVEGLPVEVVIEKLRGIDCGGRGTSCPDQLARALEAWQNEA